MKTLIAAVIATLTVPFAAQAASQRTLECRAVLKADVPNEMVVNTYLRYELPLATFTKKGSAVLADTEITQKLQDATGKTLLTLDARSFLHQNKKVAGLTLMIRDADKQSSYGSGSGQLMLNRSADDSGALEVTAPIRPALSATIRGSDTRDHKHLSTLNVSIYSATLFCNLR